MKKFNPLSFWISGVISVRAFDYSICEAKLKGSFRQFWQQTSGLLWKPNNEGRLEAVLPVRGLISNNYG